MKKSVIVAIVSLMTISAQNAAVSSHFNMGSSVAGDIQISEVRVPSAGVTPRTYYETLGFWGNKGNATGNGYGGIQESDDHRGNKVHIFSIWHALDNPNDTANFPYAVHLDYGMKAEYFGGEGVGLKTWCLTDDPRHPLYWQPDVWYTHVIRTWNVDHHTYYGFFVRDGVNEVWRHLSTVGVREDNILIKGQNDAFIEDWWDSGQHRREIHLRNNWRRDRYGEWHAAESGNYSVNYWDLDPGKRSYNYRTNWDGGVKSDESGEFFYMISGGRETAPTAPLNYPGALRATFSLSSAKESKPNYKPGTISDIRYRKLDNNQIEVTWSHDSTTLPQFAYTLSLNDETGAVSQSSETEPQKRRDTLDITGIDITTGKFSISLESVDILDNKTAESVTITGGEVSTSVLKASHGRTIKRGNNTLELQIPAGKVYTCEIFTTNGRRLKKRELNAGIQRVDFNSFGLAAGVYLINITTPEKIHNLKMSIE